MDGVEVRVVGGTTRDVPADVRHCASRLIIRNKVLKERGFSDNVYDVRVALGPERHDIVVTGKGSALSDALVRRIRQAWTGM